jgi:DNA-binding beta-propeller fold protein YncE
MLKKSTFWLTLMLGMLLPLVTACGSKTSPVTTSPGVSTLPPGENVYVLDGYAPQGIAGTSQHILAFHPGSTNPTSLISLPTGLTSMDHQKLYVATAKGGQTTINVINTQNGATIRSMVISGTFSTAGQGFAGALVSSDGHWLALVQQKQNNNATTIALVDTQAGRLAKTIQLHGNFDLDALSPDGSSLYLLQKLNDGSGHYYVKLYNVNENKLYDYTIVDKTDINERMTGVALVRQMAGDGTSAYTLYTNTSQNKAFVHILPLDGEAFPFARCVDLPTGNSADLLHYYTLTLSPDGGTLYAVNAALGVASLINLDNGGTSNIFNDRVVSTIHFNPGKTNSSTSDASRMLYNGAALSPDGKMLYVVGMNGIWAINASDLQVQRNSVAHYLTQQSFTGIGLSSDGRTLYAVDPGHGITVFDITTRQIQQVIQGPARAPWGIEWISN